MKILIILCSAAGFILSGCNSAPKQELVYVYVTNTVTREIQVPVARPTPAMRTTPTPGEAARARRMTNSVPTIKK